MPFPGIPDPKQAGIPEAPPELVASLRLALEPLLDPPEAALVRVLRYGQLLLAANTVTNLTGAKDWKRLGPHLLDCVYAARFLPTDLRSFFDWGSGGGMPGLVFACIYPQMKAHLCERNGKKADFLREAADELELLETEVHRGQGEEQWTKLDPHPELMLARAVEPLPKLLKRLTAPRLRMRNLFLMVGPRWVEEWPEEERESGHWMLQAALDYVPNEEDSGTRTVLSIHARPPKRNKAPTSNPWGKRS
jgi:16S rRNA G527 N7-methylase RsmG